MFFSGPIAAGGRIPPADPTGTGISESGTSCVLRFTNPASNAGGALVAIVEQSADGVSGWTERLRSQVAGTGANRGVTIPDPADEDDPIYYRLWLARNGIRCANPATYTRLATPVIITITVSPTGGGTVTGDGGYEKNTTATLEAFPASGFRFDRWRTPPPNNTLLSTDNPYSFTATEDLDLVARFEELPPGPWTIAVSANNGAWGGVSGGGSYENGASVTVVATPATGYKFVRWTEGGSQVSTNASYGFTATANRTLVAEFELIPVTWDITATPSDPLLGGTTGSGSYADGATVTVVAYPEPGKWFIRWSEGGIQVSTSSTYIFTATGDRTLVAEFGTDT